jgi:hypothetical protein
VKTKKISSINIIVVGGYYILKWLAGTLGEKDDLVLNLCLLVGLFLFFVLIHNKKLIEGIAFL